MFFFVINTIITEISIGQNRKECKEGKDYFALQWNSAIKYNDNKYNNYSKQIGIEFADGFNEIFFSTQSSLETPDTESEYQLDINIECQLRALKEHKST